MVDGNELRTLIFNLNIVMYFTVHMYLNDVAKVPGLNFMRHLKDKWCRHCPLHSASHAVTLGLYALGHKWPCCPVTAVPCALPYKYSHAFVIDDVTDVRNARFRLHIGCSLHSWTD